MKDEDEELADRILGRRFLVPGDLGSSPPEREAAAPGVPSIGRFEVLERLGAGGSAEVYRARHPDLGRFVALKRVRLDASARDSEEVRARFRREALALATLEHEGIPRVMDAVFGDEDAFLVMELVEGRSFDRVLAARRLSVAERVEVLEHVARIVHHAHEKGFVHRDLKPQNIILGDDGRPRVIDFGIAKDCRAAGLTQRGDVLGTWPFMSPEQARGRSDAVDARSDVFALGAILYFALSGRVPFDGPTASAIVAAITGRAPAPLEGLDPRLAAIVLRALEKDPARRHPSAAAFADELAGWRAPSLRPRGALLLVGAVALGAALGLAASLRPAPPPAPAPVPAPDRRVIDEKLRLLDVRVDDRLRRGDPEEALRALDRALEEGR